MPAPFGNIQQDFRNAGRVLVRQPGFAAIVIVTLALGIAANTTVFTIVNAVLLRDMPIDDADRVVEVGARGGTQGNGMSYADLEDWRHATGSFEDIAAVTEDPVDVADGDHPPERLRGAYASWNTLSLLRQPPAFGRAFAPSDDRGGAIQVVILGDAVWRNRYGEDPGIIGRTIRVNRVPSTVIGVMPRGFRFPVHADLWLPLIALPEDVRSARGNRSLTGIGRLRAGVGYEQALTELSVITSALAKRFPDSNRNTVPRIERFRSGIGGPGPAVPLLGAVTFVLLIACANTANLLLARAVERAREVAVRLALGASRWRVVRGLLVESLVLSGTGGLFGLALAYLGIQAFWYFVANTGLPYWVRFSIDHTVFAYLAGLSLGSAILCGLVPAWHVSRHIIAATLADSAPAGTESRARRRWMGTFVVAQIALALVLLTGATLMIRSLIGLIATDSGIDTRGLVQMQVTLPGGAYSTPEQRVLLFEQLEQRLTATTVNTALASHAPLLGAAVGVPTFGRGPDPADTVPASTVAVVMVSQRFFDVAGIPLLSGRPFAADDMRVGGDAVIVNERFAAQHFHGLPAVGQRFRLSTGGSFRTASASQGRWVTVIGVARNVRHHALESGEFRPAIYIPYPQGGLQTMAIIGRAESNLTLAVEVIRNQVRMLDAELPVSDVSTVDEKVSFYRWPRRIFGSLFSIFAAIAVLLSMFGLYSVASYAVSRRTREIGLRVALGGSARHIWWAVLGSTMWQLGIGLALGLAGAAAVSGALAGQMAEVTGATPGVLGVMVLLLALVGISASAIPYLRAVRLTPVEALRHQ